METDAVQFCANKREILPKAYSARKEKNAVSWNKKIAEMQHQAPVQCNDGGAIDSKLAVREQIFHQMGAMNDIECIVVSDDDSVIDEMQDLVETDSEDEDYNINTDAVLSSNPFVNITGAAQATDENTRQSFFAINDENTQHRDEVLEIISEHSQDLPQIQMCEGSNIGKYKVLQLTGGVGTSFNEVRRGSERKMIIEEFLSKIREHVPDKYSCTFVS